VPDRAILDQVHVLDHLVRDDAARQVPHDLMDMGDNAPVAVNGEAPWLDVRVDQSPLPGPVIPHRGVAAHVSTLHAVRPVHLGMHGGQCPLDVPGVERLIRFGEQVESLHGSR